MNKNNETKEQQIQGWYEWLKRRYEQYDSRTSKITLKTYLDNMERILKMK
ncbi:MULTISPECIES: hypothetical protein [Bacillus cereus group]|nr:MULTISPECIES: hypothetical protein [Bacillus cereus group]MEB8648112.1 hypothetical protein [Bacillus cereus]MEB8665988.1 hypothetical protein [Bacillus cereus]QUG82387.1 hypothetical protein GSN03_02415 [Bacillus nitratireducens]